MLYFDSWQPQKFGGYRDGYETFTSNNVVCNIDSVSTSFKNSKGTETSIWLWKGDYNMVFNGGWHTGAEIGAYTNKWSDKSIIKSASFTLTDANGTILDVSTAEKYWTNGFVPKGSNGAPSTLTLAVSITFFNQTDAEGYHAALKSRSNSYFHSKGGNGRVQSYSPITTDADGNSVVTVTFQ